MKRLLATLALLAGWLILPAQELAAQSAVEESLRLETLGTALLLEHYEVERAMLAPDPERLTVFLSVPAGAPLTLDESSLFIDGKLAIKHRYSSAELARLADGAVQPLYVGQLPIGEHKLRLEVRTRQGKVLPMSDFAFAKNGGPRFVELQIAGDTSRQVRASAW